MLKSDNLGKINISDEILCSCVANTARAFDAVIGFDELAAGSALGKISRDTAIADGIRLYRRDEKVTVDVFVIIKYGTQIPSLAWELQKKIHEEIKKITDEDISDINIHIEGVEFKENSYE